MTLFDTSTLTPAGTHDAFRDYQIYNGLDCCLTHEIHQTLQAEFPEPNLIYNFERAMQAPALEMMLRGLRVDMLARDAAVSHLQSQLTKLQSILDRYGAAVWDQPIQPRSPKLKDLFYETMQLPVQYKNVKGVRQPAVDRDCLEKLQDYFHAKPIVGAILAFRDIAKQISFLQSAVDRDGRIRTSYNVAGTETGRWSSSSNAFGTGANLQNYPDKLRSIFIADEGRKLAYLDLEQAESWIVGITSWIVSGDDSYINAILSGDLHTTVASMVWPGLGWTGNPREDREIADRPFYRDYSYRDLAKRGGHGTNYYGRPPTMAKHLKVTTALMEDFQHAYFSAFPGTRQWHHWVAEQLQLSQFLTTIIGRQRHFFGRPNDDTTLREAIAFGPQSAVGDLLNLAAYRVWKYGRQIGINLLAQLHDAILIDYPDDGQDAHYISETSALMRTTLHVGERQFCIPNDAAIGWNWGKFNDDPKRGPLNPAGVRKFKWQNPAPETRKRPEMSGLGRVIPSFH